MASPKFKKTEVSQRINLKEEFGVDFNKAPELRRVLGQAIIDHILNRTERGEGVSFGSSGKGTKVKLKSPYSKTYADSLDFKAAGKSKNKVNMSLTGDMLGLMDIVEESSNTITIGWSDDEQNAKAFNHSTGDTVPRRPFFGVSKSELKEIKSEFGSEIKEALRLQKEEGRKKFTEFVGGLIDRLEGEDGG